MLYKVGLFSGFDDWALFLYTKLSKTDTCIVPVTWCSDFEDGSVVCHEIT